MAGLPPVNVTWLLTTLSGDPGGPSRPPGPDPPLPGAPRSPQAGPVMVDQEFDGGSLPAVRAAVAAAARAAGLSRARVYDVVAAVHELAANAVRHGGGRGRLRVWTEEDLLHCQVSDDGIPVYSARPDDRAPWQSEPGHGLWLAREVADHASIDHSPAGTAAIVSFAIRAHHDQPH
jgi:anti-sigma regulatory factor (Ser/Thr protein kinase)